MIGKELKLIFRGEKAYLIPENPMTLTQVDIPEFTKTFNANAYWIISVINFNKNDSKLVCRVVSYHVGETDFDSNKEDSDILKTIQKISLPRIDTSALIKTSTSVNPISVLPQKESSINRNDTDVIIRRTEHFKKTIQTDILYYLKKTQFILGGVVVTTKIKEIDKTIQFIIYNDYIKEEFDAIKNYFENCLNTKKITVSITIELEGNLIISNTAKSIEVDKINEQLIENVKLDYVRNCIKRVLPLTERNVYTIDEFFTASGDDNFSINAFYKDDRELFDALLKITDTRHYKHLRLLSSKHLHTTMKLRFIPKPFSFLFLLEGSKNYHLIWETLDTEEATYLWSVEKDIRKVKTRVNKIEEIIMLIKAKGKISYINSKEDMFQRIYHDYSDSVNGFLKWKAELEGILV